MSRSSSSILLLGFLALTIRTNVSAQNNPVFHIPQIGTLPVPQVPQPFIPDHRNIGTSLQQLSQQTNDNNARMMQEVESFENKRQDVINDIKKAFQTEEHLFPVISPEKYAVTKTYWDALFQLEDMAQTNNLSLLKAIYLVENAYLDNKLPFDRFQKLITDKTELCQYIIKRDKLPDNDLAKHYAIQKLFSEKISRYDSRTKTTKVISSFHYDFNDFFGHEHWENMFVSKLLITGKGQCHSMPLLYLIMAEQLGTKAYLSFAPSHTYIQFYDPKGTTYHFETTNGKLVSNNWLMQSGFINATAIKRQTYLDTTGQKQLVADLMMDLTFGYLRKYGNDEFVKQTLKDVQSLSPNNLQALILQAQIATDRAKQAIRAAGTPPPDKLPQYPEAYHSYTEMQAAYKRIDDLGYQDMPPDVYQKWLASVKKEGQKQESAEISARLKQALKPKPVVTLKPQ